MLKKLAIFQVMLGILFVGVESQAEVLETNFHGQFRINYYSLDQDTAGLRQNAARLRWRPTWDATLPDDVKMHMQLNIGHIKDNVSNARWDNSGSNPALSLRHAVLDFALPEGGGRINAGIVPLSDKFGDTLFSGDWDFNPLAVVWLGKVGGADVRLATGKLAENNEDQVDDQSIHMIDIDRGALGLSLYQFDDEAAQVTQNYIGVRATNKYGDVNANAFIIYNDGTNDSTNIDNSGFAAKLEATTERFGIMALYATGDDGSGTGDSDSFLTPATLVGATGYWGYTGKLNIQGPTDTGIDSPLNIDGARYWDGSGSGRGIITIQAKANFPVTDKIAGYVAIGHYRHAEAAAGMNEEIGNDIYLQGKYELRQNLDLEAGIDYAMLSYNNETYNYTDDQTMLLLFARLQLEY